MEGDVGTWSHCGNRETHLSHVHDVTLNEGTYPRVLCHGTGGPHIFIWRLTLACGHLRLWGPFTDGSHEKLIGDVVSCDVCPRTKDHNTGVKSSQFHLIVNAEEVDKYKCSPAWIQTGLL